MATTSHGSHAAHDDRPLSGSAKRTAFWRTAARPCDLNPRHAAIFALAAVTVMAAVEPALAQSAGGGGDITTFLQNIINIITGTAGKLIAVIAICIVGIGALMGALSMRAAGGVILGVMLIFSSSWIVSQIVGS